MPPIDPRTPVIIGVGAAHQRCEDPCDAVDVVALMVAAARAAATDAGGRTDLAAVPWVAATKGNARLADPARLVADAIGAADAHTVLSDIGVLQTTPLGRAAELIADGSLDLALIVGGETKYRSLRAQIDGVEMDEPIEAEGAAPDEHWVAGGDVISRAEIDFGLVHPVQQYAMIENAVRAADGQSIEDHRREIAELYAAMNQVAAANPLADFGEPRTADFIATPGPDNRQLAFPYNKWHNSQWNVDQAAALLLCSAERADALGVARDQWVFPTLVIESNEMTHLINRADLHRCVGFEVAARHLHRAVQVADIAAMELYSCFPVAVRVQQRALGLDADRAVTVTGGMAFAGGPLNNFVFQAAVALVQQTRGTEHLALGTAVSGMLTKQGLALYSGTPPETAFRSLDISAEVAAETSQRPVSDRKTGCGHLAAYTVSNQGKDHATALVIAEFDDGSRLLASSTEPDDIEWLQSSEGTGAAIDLRDGKFVRVERRTES